MIAPILIKVDHNMLLANKNTTRITIKLSGGCRRRTLRRGAVAFGSAANKEQAYARNACVSALKEGGDSSGCGGVPAVLSVTSMRCGGFPAVISVTSIRCGDVDMLG
jgi:hypothetical protein